MSQRDTTVGVQRAMPDDARAHVGCPASERFRLQYLVINCPSCGRFQQLDATTPRQVFDPEIHRFACPVCLAVVRLLVYPLCTPGEPWDRAAAKDLAWHPSCAAAGVYDCPGAPAAADPTTISAVYLSLSPPDPAVC